MQRVTEEEEMAKRSAAVSGTRKRAGVVLSRDAVMFVKDELEMVSEA